MSTHRPQAPRARAGAPRAADGVELAHRAVAPPPGDAPGATATHDVAPTKEQ